jgi:hypothetical protein
MRTVYRHANLVDSMQPLHYSTATFASSDIIGQQRSRFGCGVSRYTCTRMYRATILAGGKNQKRLMVGWEVSGGCPACTFHEESKIGFISEREAVYGGQKQK